METWIKKPIGGLSKKFKELSLPKKIALIAIFFDLISFGTLWLMVKFSKIPEPLLEIFAMVCFFLGYIGCVLISVAEIIEHSRSRKSSLYSKISIIYHICFLIYLFVRVFAIFWMRRTSTFWEYEFAVVMILLVALMILSGLANSAKAEEDEEKEEEERIRIKEEQKRIASKIFEAGGIKGLITYSKSDEYLYTVDPFECLSQKYISIQKEYADSFYRLSKIVAAKVHRREYAQGGEGIHRGFYSPSATDLVVEKRGRGRLLESLPEDKNYSYEYLFDERDKLICVYSYGKTEEGHKLLSTELFIYERDKVLSLGFDADVNNGISFICECQYENGLLIEYNFAHCDPWYGEEDCYEIDVELYEYTDNLLHAFCWYRYFRSMRFSPQEKYVFTRDEDGYLSTYTVKKVYGFTPKVESDREKIPHEVSAKRK